MIWRRRNYLINKDFQFRYMARLLFGILAMVLIVSFTVYYTTWARIMDEFYNVPRIAAQFAPLFSSVNQTLLILLILFLLATAVVSVFASHTIAGPIFRFEKTIEAIAKGDLTLRIGLRKGDEFKHVADAINGMVGELRGRLTLDREMAGELVEKLQALKSKTAHKKNNTESLSEELEALSELAVRMQDNIGQFKLQK